MKNIKIELNITITDNCDTNELKRRAVEQVRRICNPVRTDEGALQINGAVVWDKHPTPRRKA